MKDFIYKFFKTINRLVKEQHHDKVYFSKDNDLHLSNLFDVWCKHKQLEIGDKNPQQYVTQDKFHEFILSLGYPNDFQQEITQYFEFVHEMVDPAMLRTAKTAKMEISKPKWY